MTFEEMQTQIAGTPGVSAVHLDFYGLSFYYQRQRYYIDPRQSPPVVYRHGVLMVEVFGLEEIMSFIFKSNHHAKQ